MRVVGSGTDGASKRALCDTLAFGVGIGVAAAGRGRGGDQKGAGRGEVSVKHACFQGGGEAGRGGGCVIPCLAVAQEPAPLVVKSEGTGEEGLMRLKCGRNKCDEERKRRGGNKRANLRLKAGATVTFRYRMLWCST